MFMRRILFSRHLIYSKCFKEFATTTTNSSSLVNKLIKNSQRTFEIRNIKREMSNSEKKNQIVVELRSDTFTKPSEKMLKAMVESQIGDASYDEDPTTIGLINFDFVI